MSKKHHYPRFEFTGYRSAPEQFRAWVNGRPMYLTGSQQWELGNTLACGGGKDAVIRALKRIWRAHLQETAVARCTYGYAVKNERRCLYIANRSARDSDIAAKQRLYKEAKAHYTQNPCGGITHTTSRLKDDMSFELVEQRQDEVDLSRPVKVYYLAPSIYVE